MRLPIPRRLTGQMIVLILATLILAQGVSIAIFVLERRETLRSLISNRIVDRTSTLYTLMADTPAPRRQRILQAMSNRWVRYRVAPQPFAEQATALASQEDIIAAISNGLGLGTTDIRLGVVSRMSQRRRRPIQELQVSLKLPDGAWLNMRRPFRQPRDRYVTRPMLISLAVTAGALMLVVLLIVRRITRPMARLADAANRLGRGEPVAALIEEGPDDIRQTTRAFNRMQQRINRFVQDRTQMLAAISHDLRTPITAARLKAEFIEDAEIRAKIVESLEEMQRMTEAVLGFAREEAKEEEARPVDLAALVESIVGDISDMGGKAAFDGPDRLTYTCRPLALKRAFRNLINNAIHYGEEALVTLAEGASAITVTVDDRGPGIPEADLERVFEPFVRLEESRSQETGGIGLGLAITRTIIHGQGGDIQLANRLKGGLRATVTLPKG